MSVADTSIPLMPAEFYGTVSIENNPAPVGTTITALLNGVVIDELTTIEAGVFGGIGIFDERLSVTIEDGDAGKHSIQFQVNGISTERVEEFAPGTSTQIELNVMNANVEGSTPATTSIAPTLTITTQTTPLSTIPTTIVTPVPTTIIATIGTTAIIPTQIPVQTIQTPPPYIPDPYYPPQIPVQTVQTPAYVPYDPYYPSQGYTEYQYERLFTSGDERAQLILYPGSEIRTAAGSTIQQATLKLKGLTGIQMPYGLAYAGYGYELVPAGLSFLPEATLSISIDEGLFDANPMIMRYESATGTWIYLPSLADRVSGMVRATITEAGIYGVVIQDMTPPEPVIEVIEVPIPTPSTPIPTVQIETPRPTPIPVVTVELSVPEIVTETPTQTIALPKEPSPPLPQSKTVWYIAGGILLIIILNIIIWRAYLYTKKEKKKQEEL